jgi:hypothetical protein
MLQTAVYCVFPVLFDVIMYDVISVCMRWKILSDPLFVLLNRTISRMDEPLVQATHLY